MFCVGQLSINLIHVGLNTRHHHLQSVNFVEGFKHGPIFGLKRCQMLSPANLCIILDHLQQVFKLIQSDKQVVNILGYRKVLDKRWK